ncbi:zinc ABC transporter ATP-binding protein AztA [Celerinatantimonas sp. YJH-8]|uniref:zinc ABC transporter ATP-binding protein AztA n=1 Tax=Celerinatantimonas sp. YJH-8 TaxID=3228714 RepID=UPI0038C9B799
MLQFSNLTLGYDRHPAVHHLSCKIETGDLLALVGPNGAGKSTLLKGIMGQLRPLGGDIRFDGNRAEDIAYLPQLNQLDRQFPISVEQVVAMGCWRHRGAFGRIRQSDRIKVQDAIEQVGLKGYQKRSIASLSGGQMQRVLFARLLVQDAKLILLDEPFNAIDTRTCDDLLTLIRQWNQQGKTIIAVLHDFQQVRHYFPKALLLSRKLISIGDTAAVMTDENLAEARASNAVFDEHAKVCNLPGEPT